MDEKPERHDNYMNSKQTLTVDSSSGDQGLAWSLTTGTYPPTWQTPEENLIIPAQASLVTPPGAPLRVSTEVVKDSSGMLLQRDTTLFIEVDDVRGRRPDDVAKLLRTHVQIPPGAEKHLGAASPIQLTRDHTSPHNASDLDWVTQVLYSLSWVPGAGDSFSQCEWMVFAYTEDPANMALQKHFSTEFLLISQR